MIAPIKNAKGLYQAWRWSKQKIEAEIDDLAFVRQAKGLTIFTKIRNFNTTSFKDILLGLPSNGSKDVALLFEGEKRFDYPKPIELLGHLIKIATAPNDLILDSFAGSGTTMHAVMALNKEDGGKRKCILVQMRENTSKEPEKNICKDITRERIKRAIEKYGYRSGFEYLRVGTSMDAEDMLNGQLPSYEKFAEYVFYLATGSLPKNIPPPSSPVKHLVGEDTKRGHSIWLIYKPDKDALANMALTQDIAEEMMKKKPKTRKIIFAPACFLDSEYMEEKNIDFVHIPYRLFERIKD